MRMTPPPDPPRTRTIRTNMLARVEGEGAHVRAHPGWRRGGRRAAHLRAAALLRGPPPRPGLPRGARHHLADLRHLPDRLPDERHQRDRGCLRRRRRRPVARAAPPDLLRRVDREPRAARADAARARLPRLRERHRARSRPSRSRAGRTPAEEDRQPRGLGGRRARDPSGQHARRRLLPRAHPTRAGARCRTSSSGVARSRCR